MIHSNKGTVQIKGIGAELLADLGVLVHSIKRHMLKHGLPEELAIETIKHAINMGLEEEKSTHEDMQQLKPQEISELLKSLFEGRRV